jgi:hypothetical protein
VASVAGLSFSLYRNDVLLDAARSGGWESRYLALEARLLGTPGWGTPRSLEPPSEPATAAPPPVVDAVSTAANAQPAARADGARATADGVAIVSLDALAAEPAPRAAAVTAFTSARAPSVTEPIAPVAKAAAAAPVAKAMAAPVAAARPTKPSAPVAKAAAVPARPSKPKAAAAVPPPANENPLKAAIRSAIAKDQ